MTASAPSPSSPGREASRRALRFLREHAWDAAYLVLASALVVAVGWDAFTTRLVTQNRGSDYWEHTATLRALLEDPWHPKHPLLVSSAIAPRFGPHFVLVALVGRTFGLDVFGTMGVGIVLNSVLFVAGIYCFFRTYFRESRASLFGLVVMFGSWFDAPHYSNVYKLSVYFSVAGYPSTAALGLMLLGLTLTLRLLRAPQRSHLALYALAALCWGYVYVTHPLTAALAFTAAALLAATEPGISLRRRLWVGGTLLGGLVVASLWPYYPALGMVAKTTASRVQEAGGRDSLHSFYTFSVVRETLGLTLLVVPILPYFLVRRRHLWVPLGALVMLAVFSANAYVRIPLGHRFLLLSVFFLQVGLVWLLLTLAPPRGAALPAWAAHRAVRIAGAVGVGATLLYTAFSNIETAQGRFKGISTKTETQPVRVGRRVGELAGPRGIVFAEALPSWSLPTFGPKIVALHHGNMLVADAGERLADVRRFFATQTSDAERARILERYRATHVLVDRRGARGAERFLDTHARVHRLPAATRLYALERPLEIH